MTILPPEPPEVPGIGDDASRDDVPNDAVSDASLRPEYPAGYYPTADASTGVQHTMAIGDGNTYVSDEDLEEDTSVNVGDSDLAREVERAGFDLAAGLPAEAEVLGPLRDDGDDGEDPVPVPA